MYRLRTPMCYDYNFASAAVGSQKIDSIDGSWRSDESTSGVYECVDVLRCDEYETVMIE